MSVCAMPFVVRNGGLIYGQYICQTFIVPKNPCKLKKSDISY